MIFEIEDDMAKKNVPWLISFILDDIVSVCKLSPPFKFEISISLLSLLASNLELSPFLFMLIFSPDSGSTLLQLDLNETVDPNSLPDSDALLFSVSLAIALFFLTFLDLPVVGGFVSIFSFFIRFCSDSVVFFVSHFITMFNLS
jgi:hypothetical protein